MLTWNMFTQNLHSVLSTAVFTGYEGSPLSFTEGIAQFLAFIDSVRSRERQAFFIGNGASSTMSSHYAADIGKLACMRTQAFTDAALLTATANDVSFERIYADPLKRQALPGDLLIAISSSGNSGNILAAVDEAHNLGCHVFTVSAMQASNQLRVMGHLNFYVDASTYGLAESAHAAALHYLTDIIHEKYSKGCNFNG